MQTLMLNALKYKSEGFKKQHSLFQYLALGQHPEFLFITCADSRVVPHLFTQANAGDLFVLRNAGNLIPPNHYKSTEKGTIAFAIQELKDISAIIICGHEKCGAVTGILNPHLLKDNPDATEMLEQFGPAAETIRKRYPNLEGDELLEKAIEFNVITQIGNLRTHDSIKKHPNIQIHGWVYDFKNGAVKVYDANKEQFYSLEDTLKNIALTRLQTAVTQEAIAYLKENHSLSYSSFQQLLRPSTSPEAQWVLREKALADGIFSDFHTLFASFSSKDCENFVQQGKNNALKKWQQTYHHRLLNQNRFFAPNVNAMEKEVLFTQRTTSSKAQKRWDEQYGLVTYSR